MIRIKLFVPILLMLMTACGKSKPVKSNEDLPIQRNEEFMNSLVKVEMYEVDGIEINGKSMLIYTEDGNRPNPAEVYNMTRSSEYYVEPYKNKKGEIVWVYHQLTDEEKKLRSVRDSLKNTMIKTDLVGKDAIPFAVTDLSGKTFSVENQKGKVIVLNFWFVACGACVAEMPELNKIVDEYKTRQVTFLGFATDNKEKLERFLTKKTFKYKIVPECEDLSLQYGVYSFPTHVIIGKDSKIKYYYAGAFEPSTIDNFKKEIDQALSNK